MAVASQTITTPAGQVDLRVYLHTRNQILPGVRDHVFNFSPAASIFLGQQLGDFGPNPMMGSGHMTQTGGHAVEIRVELGKHQGVKRGSGPFDTHNTAPDSNTRSGEANWKFYTIPMTISNHDRQVNQGSSSISDFVLHQTTQVMRSLVDTVVQDIFSEAVVVNGLSSLPVLISANDSVQGLSGATYVNYNSRGLSRRGTAPASISFTSGSFAAQGIQDFRTLYNNASEGTLQPNVGLVTYDTHERYEGVLQPQERFAGAVNVADASFGALAFRTMPILSEPNCTTNANGDQAFFLRAGEGGIRVIALSGADFQFQGPKDAGEQNATVDVLAATIQLALENRQKGCNKMIDITD